MFAAVPKSMGPCEGWQAARGFGQPCRQHCLQALVGHGEAEGHIIIIIGLDISWSKNGVSRLQSWSIHNFHEIATLWMT